MTEFSQWPIDACVEIAHGIDHGPLEISRSSVICWGHLPSLRVANSGQVPRMRMRQSVVFWHGSWDGLPRALSLPLGAVGSLEGSESKGLIQGLESTVL